MTHIYFLKGVLTIKIGITRYPKSRIAELQRLNGETLELLGVIPGSFGLEKHLHRTLAEHRLHGEWFIDCREVRATIEQVISGGPKAVGYVGPKAKKPLALGPPRPHNEIVAGMANLFWPNEALQKLAEFTEQPVEVCRKWLSGDEEMPRLLRMAFACATMRYLSNDEIPMPDTWRRGEAA